MLCLVVPSVLAAVVPQVNAGYLTGAPGVTVATLQSTESIIFVNGKCATIFEGTLRNSALALILSTCLSVD